MRVFKRVCAGELTKKEKEESGLEVFFDKKKRSGGGMAGGVFRCWKETFFCSQHLVGGRMHLLRLQPTIHSNVLDFAKNISQISFLNCKMNDAGKVFYS